MGELGSLLVSESVKTQPLQKTQFGTPPMQINKQNRMNMNGNKQEEARRKKGGRLYDFVVVVVLKWIR